MSAEIVWFYAYGMPHDPVAIARQEWRFALRAFQAALSQLDRRDPASIERYEDAHRRRCQAWRRYRDLVRG